MEGFFRKCVETFQHLAGDGVQMKNVPTPFVRESPGPAYAPSQEGEWLMCPFCTGCYSPADFQKGNTSLPAATTKKMREKNTTAHNSLDLQTLAGGGSAASGSGKLPHSESQHDNPISHNPTMHDQQGKDSPIASKVFTWSCMELVLHERTF